MGQCAFVSELAVSLDIPRADVLLLPRFIGVMRKWTRRSCGARPNFEKFAGHVGEIFDCSTIQHGQSKEVNKDINLSKAPCPWIPYPCPPACRACLPQRCRRGSYPPLAFYEYFIDKTGGMVVWRRRIQPQALPLGKQYMGNEK